MKCDLTFLFFVIFSLFILTNCSKKHELEVEDKITYTYNGQQFTDKTPGCIRSAGIWQPGIFIEYFAGLVIDNPAMLGGKVWLWGSTSNPWTCGYLEPTGSSVYQVMGNCNELRTNGGPIDSVAVYLYESGSLQITSNECTPGTGYCSVTGTFNATLVNKNGQRIELTNGSFSGNY